MNSEYVGRDGDYLVYRTRVYNLYSYDPKYIEYRIYSPVTTTGSY